MSQQEVTTGEIMEFLKENMVVKEEFNGLEKKFDELRDKFGGLRDEFGGLRDEVRQIKADVLDGMDVKLSDLRGDLVVLTRKEDVKLRELITILHTKNILTDPEAKRILTMEPFPQLIL